METMTNGRAATAAGFVLRLAVPTLDPVQGTGAPIGAHIVQGSGAPAGGHSAGLYKRLRTAIEHDSVREQLPV